jgi:hypothetical protein
MKKIKLETPPRFQDIPQFTRSGNYQVDSHWQYIHNWLGMESEIVFDRDPDFQRAHVWTEEQQIRYIEFVLRGGKSSTDIYWNCDSWGRGYNTPVVLVDGKQRVRAVERFIDSEIKIFGFYYKEFTDKLPLHARFRMHVNDLPTRAEVLQWYLDLNEGGVVHTDEELTKVKKLLKAEKIVDFVRRNP